MFGIIFDIAQAEVYRTHIAIEQAGRDLLLRIRWDDNSPTILTARRVKISKPIIADE